MLMMSGNQLSIQIVLFYHLGEKDYQISFLNHAANTSDYLNTPGCKMLLFQYNGLLCSQKCFRFIHKNGKNDKLSISQQNKLGKNGKKVGKFSALTRFLMLIKMY